MGDSRRAGPIGELALRLAARHARAVEADRGVALRAIGGEESLLV